MLGTVARAAYPGIFDLSHSIGNVMGVSPSTLKSYALCVYFQMYSPSITRNRPNACWRPAWNSLRNPELNGVELTQGLTVEDIIAFTTGSLHPTLARTRFSLKGVSSVRA